jgi:predicted O-linked N-acetylglucosamine transferase (SPINDLY family)
MLRRLPVRWKWLIDKCGKFIARASLGFFKKLFILKHYRAVKQMNWHPELKVLLAEENYPEVVQFYEQLLEIQPEITSNYWYLGLAYLLQGQENEAQAAWFSAVANQSEEIDSEWLSQELLVVLTAEAEHQRQQEHLEYCWLIRQHILNISDQNMNNILEILLLSLDTNTFTPNQITALGLIDLLGQTKTQDLEKLDQEKVFKILKRILEYPAAETLDLAKVTGEVLSIADWENLINSAARTAGFLYKTTAHMQHAVALLEICLDKYPNSFVSLENYARFLPKVNRYAEGLQAAQKLYEAMEAMPYKYAANTLILDALMWSGSWWQLPETLERHKAFTQQFIAEQSVSLPLGTLQNLVLKTPLLQYFEDNPVVNHQLANEVGKLFCKNIYANNQFPIPLHGNFSNQSPKKIKIGYLSHTLREHSVGWLCRWLFQYHDRERFEINAYLLGQTIEDPFFQKFFADKFDKVVSYEKEVKTMAEQISQDQINILVDLDSSTSGYSCTVLSLKPAPVQVTWLGYDAAGLPTIDYYLADNYVLPSNAQDYYQEKIWRLPETYIAVDGFEMDVPSLKRHDLGISKDGITFLTAQAGLKRNPETVKLQLQVIEKVPNSYLLIKGLGDQEALRSFFLDLADQVGVSHQKLIFLPRDQTSFTHRANLQIADVVLDTYPYNGATTTLETLWAGVPVVTMVGQQFASRNSYAFLSNAGITEGIATSAEEYVNWGVRFGTDESLRQRVAMKLRESRHTSPLWNAQKFTREMEDAYEQMWQIYLENEAF